MNSDPVRIGGFLWRFTCATQVLFVLYLQSKSIYQKLGGMETEAGFQRTGRIVLDPDQTGILKPTKLDYALFILYQEPSARK